MKWNKAIKQIETALALGKEVAIDYHRKWNTCDAHIDRVDGIVLYDWHGEQCKAVSTFFDLIDEGSHIIDDVSTDPSFFMRGADKK